MEVVLLHPYRHQATPGLRQASVFDYYGIAPSFTVRTLPNWDLVRWDRWIPKELFLRMSFSYEMFWTLYAAVVARREHADLYFTRESNVAYWLTRLGMPTVFEAHMIPKRAQRRLVELFCRKPALRLVVTLTSFAKDRFHEIGVPEEKIVVRPSGVDLGLYDQLPSREDCRRRLGLPESEPIVGYVGRFEAMGMEKGVLNLVRSMALISRPSCLICVGGPMDLASSYIQEAEQLGIPAGRIRFVDQVPHAEVALWIRACDVVTLPWSWTDYSAYVTSPMKLFEYMAGGTPIVASDLPSLREILTNGVNARLVKAGDPSALSQGIDDLLGDSRLAASLAVQARKDVARHTWAARATEILRSALRTDHLQAAVTDRGH